MTEEQAEAAILKWCRDERRGGNAVQPVMRELRGVHSVIDVGRTEPVPGRNGFGRRSVIMASGEDWTSLLLQLPLSPGLTRDCPECGCAVPEGEGCCDA